MTDHEETGLLLYEFAAGELSPDARAAVERHLAGCTACREDLAAMREVLAAFPAIPASPADERPAPFWGRFPENVEKQIRNLEAARARRTALRPDDVPARVLPRLVFGAAGALALLVAVFLLVSRTALPPSVAPENAAHLSPGTRSDTTIGDYFRRSKVLLVGLTNLDLREGEDADLEAERKKSGELLDESRRLRQKPLDPRSARVIDDMEKIFLKAKNIDPGRPADDVALLREGIERNNLLFRVRMSEAAYGQASIVRAGGGEN